MGPKVTLEVATTEKYRLLSAIEPRFLGSPARILDTLCVYKHRPLKIHLQESANLQIADVNVMDSALTADYKARSSALLVVPHSALCISI